MWKSKRKNIDKIRLNFRFESSKNTRKITPQNLMFKLTRSAKFLISKGHFNSC